MFIKGAMITLLLALALASGLLWAQDEDQDAPGQEEPPAAQEAEQAPASPSPAVEPVTPGADSPFDYEASEQISEDLSVSFPVDI